MKLPHQQLEQHLSKNLAPIYIVSGDELLLAQEATDLIRHAAVKAGFTERTLIVADTSAEWSRSLYANTQSMSLFATKQIIELNMCNTKFTANNTKSLQEYVEKPQADIVLIIRTNKIDGKTEKAAWFQALEKKSVYFAIWPIPAAQLPQWVSQRAKKSGINLSKDTAELIAHQAEGNLLAAAQEVEKMGLLYCNRQTNENYQPANTTENDNARFNVFDLVDSTLMGNNSRSLRILRSLEAEDTEPTLILWALTREFRMLADMLAQLKQGTTLSSLFNKFHIFEKRQASIRAFLQKYSLEKCWSLLLHAAQVDRIIKGAEKGNVWIELENIVLIS